MHKFFCRYIFKRGFRAVDEDLSVMDFHCFTGKSDDAFNKKLLFVTLSDWDKAGVEMVTALIEVRVTPQRDSGFDRIAERLYNYPEVYAVYLISGSYDLLVTLEGKTLKEVSRFVSERLSTIDGVLSTATYFILKKYKDHGTIMGVKKGSERIPVTL